MMHDKRFEHQETLLMLYIIRDNQLGSFEQAVEWLKVILNISKLLTEATVT